MKSKFKKVLAASLSAIMLVSVSIPQTSAYALTYNGSSSYKSGKYYTALKKVQLTGNQRTDIVNVAKSQIGYQEGSSSSQLSGTKRGNGNKTEYGRWYGLQDMWCAMFVSWCSNVAGVSTSIVPKHCFTPSGLSWFKSRGRAYSRSSVAAGKYTPQPGDIIYFKSSRNKNSTNHIGIVTKYSGKTIYTIEGNTSSATISTNGGAVAAKSYSINNTYIVYVCKPAYKGTSSSSSSSSKPATSTTTNSNTGSAGIKKLKEVNLGDDFYAKVTNTNANLNLSISNQTNVISYTKSTSDAQVWRFVRQSDGSYEIKNKKYNKCMDVASGTNVDIYTDNNSSAQRWRIYSVSGGYVLKPNCSSSCVMDVANGSKSAGANIQIYTYNGSAAQKFTINKIVDPNAKTTISNVKISDVTSTGYTVSCTATSGNGIKEVKFPTWTEANGQDDIIWHQGTKNGDTYSYRVNVKDHKYEGGKYITHIYAYDNNGKSVVAASSATVSTPIADIGTNFYAKINTTVNSGLNLSLLGTDVITYGNSSKPAQIWKFVRQSNGSYKIINTKTNQVLSVKGGVKALNAGIEIANDTGAKYQRWFICPVNGGYVLKPHVAMSYSLDVKGASTAAETKLQVYTSNTSKAQIFKLNKVNTKPTISDIKVTNVTSTSYTVSCTATSLSGIKEVKFPTWTEANGQDDIVWHQGTKNGDTYSFTVKTSAHKNEVGKYITHIYAYGNDGTNSVSSTSATIKTDAVDLGADFYAQITNPNANLNLSINNKTDVIIYTKSSSDAQLWRFVRQADGSYEIKNKKYGKCLDVSGGKNASGTNVDIYTDNNSKAQRWFIYSIEGGYRLKPACATSCSLDVKGAKKTSGTTVQIYTTNNSAAQVFKINKVDSSSSSSSTTTTTTSTDKNKMAVIRKIIYAVETGGQVYGKADYTDFTPAYTNSSAEHAITIGAGQWYGTEAKTLLNKIRAKDPSTFKKLDTAGIAKDLDSKNWSTYKLSRSSAKAKCIQKIIGTSVGRACQDALLEEQMAKYMKEAASLGVTKLDAQMMCANMRHQGGLGAVKRVLKKTAKPYTLDNIYKALQSDTGNQVGAYKSRQKMVYNALKKYL